MKWKEIRRRAGALLLSVAIFVGSVPMGGYAAEEQVLEELQEINDDYCIEDFLPNHIIIGSNGNGELYGIDNSGNYFNVPIMIDKEDVTLLGDNIDLLPDKINDLWK